MSFEIQQKRRWGAFWARNVAGYADPYFAVADTSLKPTTIDIEHVGHHTSVGVGLGKRMYVFETQKNRDRFVFKYKAFGAKPCRNLWNG